MKIFSLVVLFSHLILGTRGSGDTLETLTTDKCEYSVQQNIYNSLPQCLPRRTLVDLRQYLADDHDIIQVERTIEEESMSPALLRLNTHLQNIL